MRKTPLQPGLSAMLEVGIMFLPAIPAYVWMWPNVKNTDAFTLDLPSISP